jgi:hypothetical protein
MLVISLYIIVGVVLVDKEYLLTTTPSGTVRLGLLPPGTPCCAEPPCCVDAEGNNAAPCSECLGLQQAVTDLPYCVGYTGREIPELLMTNPYTCRYNDDKYAVWPGVEPNSVLAASRVTTTVETNDACVTSNFQDYACYDSWEDATIPPDTSYVSQIEDFTAFIGATAVQTIYPNLSEA